MQGYIYIVTNLVNNKKYIGKKTSKVFLENYLGSGKLIVEAVNKYGRENFKVELIEECNSKEDLDKQERYWIRKYNADISDEFYNIQSGGNTFSLSMDSNFKKYLSRIKTGTKLSEEHKRKIRENTKIAFQSLELRSRMSKSHLGIKHSEEFRRKVSESKKGYKNPMFGKTFSKEHRKKMSEALLGERNPQYGKKCINDGVHNKFVYEYEIQEYLDNGWKVGLYRPNRVY